MMQNAENIFPTHSPRFWPSNKVDINKKFKFFAKLEMLQTLPVLLGGSKFDQMKYLTQIFV